MAGLYKKEVVVRPTSTITVQGAKDFAKNWLNDHFQNADDNKDSNDNYIDYFFADVFDARDGNIYRVFSDACASKYEMTELEFVILDKVEIDNSISTIKTTVTEANEKLDAIEEVVFQAEAVVI